MSAGLLHNRRYQKKNNKNFQEVCCIANVDYSGDPAAQRSVFVDVRLRYFGGFDGNPRRAVVRPVDETEADYAHVLLPAVQFNVRLLKCRQFVRVVGE